MKIESLREFADTIVSMLRDEFDERYEITSGEVLKNNSVRMFGIIIRKPNEDIGPTFYVNEYYEDFITGRSLSDIVRQIIEIYQTTKYGGRLNFDFPVDFESVRDRICFRVVNAGKNHEMLSQEPFVPVLDLALEFFAILEIPGCGCGDFRVKNETLDCWNVDTNDLVKEAVRNTPRIFPIRMLTMWDKFRETIPVNGNDFFLDFYDEIFSEMFILTNITECCGAAGIFYEGAAQQIRREMSVRLKREVPSNVIVLPSSVHELILLPEDRTPGFHELMDMISFANENAVGKMDYLSDHPYRFNLETGRLDILSEENIHRKEFSHAY